MQGTSLKKAIMRDCNLFMVELQDADLLGVDLQGADLQGANLQGAEFVGANLKRADLSEALGFTQDQLDDAEIDDTTRLPEDLA